MHISESLVCQRRRNMWSAPKTNWKPTDYFTYRDFNRIAGNMDYVRAKIEDVIGENTDEYQELSMNKVVNSKPYASEFNKFEENLLLLNVYDFDIGDKKVYRISGHTPNYEDFNRLESTIEKIKGTLETHKANIPKLAFTLGNYRGI